MSVRSIVRVVGLAAVAGFPALAAAQGAASDSTPPAHDSTSHHSPAEILSNDLPVPIKAHIGGLFQIEDRGFLGDGAHAYTEEIVLRRARLDLTGTVADHFDFRFLPDFGLGTLTIQDFWVNVRYTDLAQFQFGKFKEPVGLELTQHDQNMLFIERSLATDLVPNRDVGAQVHGVIGHGIVEYNAGIFDGVPDGGSADLGVGKDRDYSGRIILRPFATSGISALSELGLGGGGTVGHHIGTDAVTSCRPTRGPIRRSTSSHTSLARPRVTRLTPTGRSTARPGTATGTSIGWASFPSTRYPGSPLRAATASRPPFATKPGRARAR